MPRPGWATLVLVAGVAVSAGLLVAGTVLHPSATGWESSLACTACHGGL